MSADTCLDVRVAYRPASLPELSDSTCRLVIPTDGERADAKLTATLQQPSVVRDSVLALGDVLASDLRRRARDRADYLAYLISKGKGVSKAVWDAQREFLALKYGEAAKAESALDPVLTVAPEGLRLEVFSRDESAYAHLFFPAGAAYSATELSAASTHVDLSSVLKPFARLRAHRETTVQFAPADAEAPRQPLHVPLRWARAFGQMQSASILPLQSFPLAPVDLYNVLFTLRMQKATKPPRALRYELVPGEAPRIVIEPWDLVLKGGGGVFQGKQPSVVRTWGRNRLQVLARLLPHARSVTVHLVGPGVPAFYVVDLGVGTFTLALSGWTDAGWAGISTFDLLDPGKADPALAARIAELLAVGPKRLDALVVETQRTREDVRAALLGSLLTGTVGHDVATGTFFARKLFATPPPLEQLRYRDEREEKAHRLLEVKEQVRVTRMHDLGADGRSIEGEIQDQQAKRAYRPSFTVDREGRTTQAVCTCATFQRSGIREGPCEHMIALRLAYTREQAALERARETEEGRKLIRAETRTLLKRVDDKTLTYRVSLDDRKIVTRFGPFGAERLQQQLFDQAEAARGAYFARLEELLHQGFIDASSAE